MIDQNVIDQYLPTIGVECHVQFNTKTKLFSGVGNDARFAAPNTLVSPICFGLPGTLPVLNERAIEFAVRAAFALNTQPEPFSQFDRKLYFYPDLPKGYQITQYHFPVIAGGSVTIVVDGQEKKIGITRAHLEEDAGKNTHPAGKDYSLIDLNRAGTPLLEIVSEPELHTAAEVKAYARELFLSMKYAGISNANLYYGNMRFDVNVSVSKDKDTLGTRSETKNLNSFRSVEKAVEYEVKRQIELLEKGQPIVQETRGWDDAKQKTFSQRSKEDLQDYRYFPEPDIPPVTITKDYVEKIRATMPALPAQIREDLKKTGISVADIETLLVSDSSDSGLGYIATLRQLQDQPEVLKYAVNWMINRHLVLIQKQQSDIEAADEDSEETKALPSAEQFKSVYALQVTNNKLSSNNADSLLADLIGKPDLVSEAVAEEKGYIQTSETGELQQIIEQAIVENPKAAEDIQKGETKAIGFLVGQVMKLSKGRANPAVAEQLIKQHLKVD